MTRIHKTQKIEWALALLGMLLGCSSPIGRNASDSASDSGSDALTDSTDATYEQACVPRTSCGQARCGAVDDGCGGEVVCGSCDEPMLCGAGGVPNQCGLPCGGRCPLGLSCDAQTNECVGPLTGLVIDQQHVEVRGTILVDGAEPIRNAAYCAMGANYRDELAVVELRDPVSGFAGTYTVTCSSPNFDFVVRVPVGHYEARIVAGIDARDAGVNVLPGRVLINADVNVESALTNLRLNESRVRVSGVVRSNGAIPTRTTGSCTLQSSSVIAEIHFRGQSGYERLEFIPCSSTDFAFSADLPPDNYEIRVRESLQVAERSTSLSPADVLVSTMRLDSDVSGLVLNQVLHRLTGRVTVGGQTPARSPGYCAISGNERDQLIELEFFDRTQDYRVHEWIRCPTTDFAFSTFLPAGEYEVRVADGLWAAAAGMNVLPGSYLAQSAFQVAGEVTGLVLDEPLGVSVSGAITQNGVTPGQATCESGQQGLVAHFVSDVYRDEVSVPCGSSLAFVTRLPTGSYDVSTANGRDTLYGSPIYDFGLSQRVQVTGPESNLVLNQMRSLVDGQISIGGAIPTLSTDYCSMPGNESDQLARIEFRELFAHQYATWVRCNSSMRFSLELPHGSYEVRLAPTFNSADAGLRILPVAYLVDPHFVVSGPRTELTFDEPLGTSIEGHVQVNGVAPVLNTTYCSLPANARDRLADLVFLDRDQDYEVRLPLSCSVPEHFMTTLPRGSYEVQIRPGVFVDYSNFLNSEYLAVVRIRVP